jgi:hypothetical protein
LWCRFEHHDRAEKKSALPAFRRMEETNGAVNMRQLVAILIFAMATVAQAKQDGDARSAGRPKDSPKATVTTPDRLLWPKDARGKARGKTVETVIPDICTGC